MNSFFSSFQFFTLERFGNELVKSQIVTFDIYLPGIKTLKHLKVAGKMTLTIAKVAKKIVLLQPL